MNKDLTKYNEVAEILKAIAHPVRLCIVNGLLEKGKCNVSYMQECLDTPQSTISQHLQKLRSAGIIKGNRNGLEVYYTISNESVAKLIRELVENM
ncbi:putative transcriptional repressor PagR [Gottschalkia purinilytica]|uniref:Putative transcriptional repressor PagR n=1 Tax=Gottschalkia purinilytica TaxID=1503 RepID=A0A0L0W825_GOTPU|nr:metalloregulator ArsR/SmtB family transcription factor [Gottschalkia purinilytica]KNF07723.1 putative transcriptional repressor PagR [Gottschalkia purinilytica]